MKKPYLTQQDRELFYYDTTLGAMKMLGFRWKQLTRALGKVWPFNLINRKMRETGYYWVIAYKGNQKDVAYYNSEIKKWWTVGSSKFRDDCFFYWIGETRIKNPDEK